MVAGSILPTAVVSVNGELADVDGQGRFTALVPRKARPKLWSRLAPSTKFRGLRTRPGERTGGELRSSKRGVVQWGLHC